MRVFSFAQESSRFCNYSKNKFDNNITYIIPSWINLPDNTEINIGVDGCIQYDDKLSDIIYSYSEFFNVLSKCEVSYLNLINKGWSPQQARAVLPNALKSEIVITGFASDWNELFDKRTSIAKTGMPHPDMIEIMNPLYNEFIKRKYINGEKIIYYPL